MKNIIKGFYSIAVIILLGGLCVFSAFANDLTAYDERGILTDIHNKCWDNWCEGGFKFNFYSFNCSFDEGECLFEFEYTGWSDVEGSYEVGCYLSAGSVEDLFLNEDSFEISEDMFWQISDCIDSTSGSARDYYLEMAQNSLLD